MHPAFYVLPKLENDCSYEANCRPYEDTMHFNTTQYQSEQPHTSYSLHNCKSYMYIVSKAHLIWWQSTSLVSGLDWTGSAQQHASVGVCVYKERELTMVSIYKSPYGRWKPWGQETRPRTEDFVSHGCL